MATRTAARRTTGNGSQRVPVEHTADARQTTGNGSQRVPVEHIAGTVGFAGDMLNTFVHVAQQIGSEVLDSTTAAFRDGLEVSATVQGAVLDATREVIGSFTSPAQALESWNRLLDTSARAYIDYATHIAGAADDVASTIREAAHVLSEEVNSTVARLGR